MDQEVGLQLANSGPIHQHLSRQCAYVCLCHQDGEPIRVGLKPQNQNIRAESNGIGKLSDKKNIQSKK